MSVMKRSSWAVLGAACAFFAVTAIANANQRVVSAASAVTYTYSLAAGASSKAFAVPANVPVHLVGTQTTTGFRGVGEASLLHIPSSFIEWVGLESAGGAAITQGFSGVAGTHIVYIDFVHQVDVEVAGTDTIQVTNKSSGTRTGSITLVW